jgi:hypothetical protein
VGSAEGLCMLMTTESAPEVVCKEFTISIIEGEEEMIHLNS